MMRRHALLAIPAALVATLAALAARAAEDVFRVVPHDALAFVAVNRLAETDAKFQKLGRQLQLPAPGLLALIKARTGIEKGLDSAGAIGVVVLPGSDPTGPPAAIVLAPVTDYQEFLAALEAKPGERITELKIAEQDMLAGNRGGYAVIGMSADRQAVERILDAKRSAAEEFPALASWLAENDVVAVATAGGIKRVSQRVQVSMQQWNEAMARLRPEGQPAASPFGMIVEVLKGMEKQIGVIGIACRLDKQGTLRITSRTRFVAGSALAAKLGAIRPAEQGPLVGLPAGPFALAGGGPMLDSWMHGGVIMKTDIVKQSFRELYGLDDKQVEELIAKMISAAPKGIRALSITMGPGGANDPVLNGMAGIYRADSATQFLDAYEKYVATLKEFQENANAPKLKIAPTTKRTEVGGRPALEIEMVPDVGGQMPDFDQKMAKLFGQGGKMKFVMVAADEHAVIYTLADEKLVSRAIQALKEPSASLAADPLVAETAALLPAGAQWVIYISPSGATAIANQFLAAMLPEEARRPNIPEFPPSPPIGLAITAATGELQTEIVLSADVLGAIAKYMGKVRDAENTADFDTK